MRLALSKFHLQVIPPRAEWKGPGAEYESMIESIQRFRGTMYRQDGAIASNALDSLGRHRLTSDVECYHAYVTDDRNALAGCVRILTHAAGSSIDKLSVFPFLLSLEDAVASAHAEAIRGLMKCASEGGLLFGEVGGWAVSRQYRNTRLAIELPLIAYSILEWLGSAIAIAYATYRHRAACILKRLGSCGLIGSDGRELGSHYSEFYRCEMEVVSSDTRCPADPYKGLVQSLARELAANSGLMVSL